MFKKKKIKFYLHQDTHIKITSFRTRTFVIKKFFTFLFEVVFEVCFKFGKFVFKFIKTTWLGINRELKKTQYNLYLKIKNLKSKNPLSNLLILFLGLASIAIFIFVVSGIGNAKLAINKILHLGYMGKQSLENASGNLGDQNLSQAQNSLIKASAFFTNAQKEFTYLNEEAQLLFKIVPLDNEANQILELGKIFSQAGQELIDLGQTIDNIKISSSGFVDQKNGNLPETLNSIENSVQKIQASINEAEKILTDLNTIIYPNKFRSEILNLQSRFSNLKTSFNSVRDIFFALRTLFENNNKILLILQNNNELRPTGGFMGTLAEIKMKDGVIENLKVESVYEKDGQLTEKIVPPHPIMNVNSRWYLRDSNWFADFPKSARKIQEFFEKEGGETPNAIIAITPKLITDLLSYTGPIYLSKYDVTLTSENFVEIAQIGTSSSFNDPENKPKQFLADMIPVLLTTLSKAKTENPGQLLLILQKNLSEKNIQFFSTNNELQNSFLNLGWTGKVLDSKNDYLYIISSNLEGTKTDLFIKQNIQLISEVQKDGSIINTLKISRENRLPKLSKTFNNSFLRILVPKGSILLSNQGFNYKILDTKSLDLPTYDSDVLNWENGVVRDLQTGTIIGTENNKTFFGNWLNVQGGETKTVTLVYRLPSKISENKQFSLIVQKQPGALPQDMEYQLISTNFEPIFTTKSGASAKKAGLLYNFVLSQDNFFGFIFRKKHGF